MKRKLIFVLALTLLFVMLCGFKVEEPLEIVNEKELKKALSEDTLDVLDQLGLSDLTPVSLQTLSPSDMLELIFHSFLRKIKEPFGALLTFLIAGIFCMILQSFQEKGSGTDLVYQVCCSLAASSAVLLPLSGMIRSVSATIRECSDFMLGFIPVYTSFTAAGGTVVAASGYHTLVIGMTTVISRLISEIAVPLIGIFMALCVVGTVSPVNMNGLSHSVKSFILWFLGLLTAVFSGVMGLGTLVSAPLDRISGKTLKYIVGSGIPIFGGIAAETLSTVKSCLLLAKNMLGVYAIFVIAAIFVPPLLTVLTWKIVISVGETVGSFFDNKMLTSLLSGTSTVIGILLALLVMIFFLFTFSITVLLLCGGA